MFFKKQPHDWVQDIYIRAARTKKKSLEKQQILLLKHLNFVFFDHQISEFAFKTGSANEVVVYPVVVAAAGFAHHHAVVLEAVLVEPRFGYFAVCFGARCKEKDDVAFIVPFVQNFEGIGKRFDQCHALRLFVRDILCDGAIDVDKVVFNPIGQYGRRRISVRIDCVFECFLFQFVGKCIFDTKVGNRLKHSIKRPSNLTNNSATCLEQTEVGVTFGCG